MQENKKYTFKELSEKHTRQTLSETESEMLDAFLHAEYEAAAWNSAEMGSKSGISASIYTKIKRKSLKKPFRSQYKFAIAACIAVLAGLGMILKPQFQEPVQLIFKTTDRADSLELKDGSMIYLAANSRLQYPATFDTEVRNVALLGGNAFFKVAKNPSRPFVVRSGDVQTRVLGTSFHIGLSDKSCLVSVVTGKVSVSAADQNVQLSPNEEVQYQAGRFKKQKSKDSALYSWYKKEAALSGVTLEQVLKLLKFRFGVDFDPVNPETLFLKMTIYIKKEDSLQNILDQINYITNLKFRKHGNKIVVSL